MVGWSSSINTSGAQSEPRMCRACLGHLFRGFLSINGTFFTHGGQDNDIGVLLFGTEKLLDLFTDFAIRQLDIVLGGAIIRHEGQETIVSDVEQLVFATADIRDLHVVGGGREIFQLLAGKDVNGDQVNLRVAVLSGLGGRHLDDLAWATLDDNEAVLSQGGTLHGVGGRSTGVGGLEGVLMLSVVVFGHVGG